MNELSLIGVTLALIGIWLAIEVNTYRMDKQINQKNDTMVSAQ